MERDIILIAHDMRSCHNVGALLRTAEGLGVVCVYLTGYTPYPASENDQRLPHDSAKIHKQIIKTALGAESLQKWSYTPDPLVVIQDLKNNGYVVVGLEQDPQSHSLPTSTLPNKVAVLLGTEVTGLSTEQKQWCDELYEIPMFGHKESFNVVQAAAMVLYHARFSPLFQ